MWRSLVGCVWVFVHVCARYPPLPSSIVRPPPTTPQHTPTPLHKHKRQAQRALDAETARVRAYLHGVTEKTLLPAVVEELLGKHVHTLVGRCGEFGGWRWWGQ